LRSTSNKGVIGGTLTVTGSPFTKKEIGMFRLLDNASV